MSSEGLRLDKVARLIGDPTRIALLNALMDGRAWTGRELACAVHVVPSTASAHLQQLVDGALLSVVAQGRHRHYTIASPEVAQALEALTLLAPQERPRHAAGRSAAAELRAARTCYDHFAGRLGVALCDALLASGAICFEDASGTLMPDGLSLFARLDIPLATGAARRPLCRPCLDWSERRPHLAGRAGASLAAAAFERGWVRRIAGTRAVAVSDLGRRALREAFGLELPARPLPAQETTERRPAS